ncbi:Uncharacterised protein [Vibrio cholerae]|nr:hypothetical protein VCSRO187_2934 [Vibrio cholerae]CSI55568.1 Uncharacterised protein [Vibrio cholerae]
MLLLNFTIGKGESVRIPMPLTFYTCNFKSAGTLTTMWLTCRASYLE